MMHLYRHENIYVIVIPTESTEGLMSYLPWTSFMLTKLRRNDRDDDDRGDAPDYAHIQSIEALLRQARRGLLTAGTIFARENTNMYIRNVGQWIAERRDIRGYGTDGVTLLGMTPEFMQRTISGIPTEQIGDLCDTLDRRLPNRNPGPSEFGKRTMMVLWNFLSNPTAYVERSSSIYVYINNSRLSDLVQPVVDLAEFHAGVDRWVRGYLSSIHSRHQNCRIISPKIVLSRIGDSRHA